MSKRVSLTDAEWEQARRALMELGGVREMIQSEWMTDDDDEYGLGGQAGYEAYKSLCRKFEVRL